MTGGFVTIVSGLPRSGTSLMMQMLQAGGVEPLTDGQRAPDEHNPRGYFELEKVKHGAKDLSWLEQANGKAVKVIHLLLPQLPEDREYRVVFMLRNIGEVVDSQRVMLQKQGKPRATLSGEGLAAIFEKQLATVRQWLGARSNFRVLYVDFKNVIQQPMVEAGRVSEFLGGGLAVSDMAVVATPALYRQRKEIP
jgi:hypothetical protein